MKRDMDLWRRILLDVQSIGPATGRYGFPNFQDVDGDILNEHCRLLIEDDMLDGKVKELGHGGLVVEINRLKNRGHDFLADITDDSVWSKTKERAKSVGGSVSLEVLKALATTVMKAHLGL